VESLCAFSAEALSGLDRTPAFAVMVAAFSATSQQIGGSSLTETISVDLAASVSKVREPAYWVAIPCRLVVPKYLISRG
jgi:hypothetical protein